MSEAEPQTVPTSVDQGRVVRDRSRSLQSGFSLVARGEPKIWFTGGMLIICLAMIVGLLLLILFSGLPAFWPRPLELLALNDGSLEIGQFQKSRRETVDDPESPASLRRYYRTGNFDLTNRHYRWLNSSELGAEGIGSPEWALVVERMEWGRLYGMPLYLSETSEISEDDREWLESLSRIEEVLASTSSDNGTVEAATEAIQAAAAARLDERLRESLEAIQQRGSALVQFQSEGDAAWQSSDSLNDEVRVAAVRATWSEYEPVYAALQASVRKVTGLRRQADRIKHEISRLDGRISRLRASVRRAELDTETQLVQPVEGAHYFIEEQVRLGDQAEQLQELRSLVEELFAYDGELKSNALNLLSEFESTVLEEQRQAADEQLQGWAEPFEEQPQDISVAVSEYQQGYRRIVVEKQPLERELERLELEMEQAEVGFAVPSSPQGLDVQSEETFQSLRDGTVTEELKKGLAGIGVDLSDEPPQVEPLGEHLLLVRIRDKVAGARMLAAVEPGYLDGEQAAPTKLSLLQSEVVPVSEIVRVVDVNRLGWTEKFGVYASRWREFLFDNPREANTEGGVFPAIWGTIVMTMIMTVAVVPFGVMAALYLREYTKTGPLVSLIRISINNLAGVPSIVYGVFGFSFFCYTIGAFIDGGARNADITPLPPTRWFFTLGATALLGTIAFFFSFFSGGPSHSQSPRKQWMSRGALIFWLLSVIALAFLVLKSPFFSGFYREYLPNPTFGKGGLLWGALTLALLTLPVVIVATEEALAAVPNSLREGSLACGASQWQTIWRIVLPHARPGILTGAILAMARGAGEVAPLMLVGALPSAPELPLDGEFPFFHVYRSFMHLGYQIYTLGFQSQNSEAAKPMVFTCTLLLIMIVAVLNISAIYLRAKLRRRFQGNQF